MGEGNPMIHAKLKQAQDEVHQVRENENKEERTTAGRRERNKKKSKNGWIHPFGEQENMTTC